MQLAKLFTPVKSLEADEARDYIAKHREGEYTHPGRAPARGIRGVPYPRGASSCPCRSCPTRIRNWTRKSPPSCTAPWAAAAGWRPRCCPAGGSRRSITWRAASRPFKGTRPPAPGSSTWTWCGATKPRRQIIHWPTAWKRPCNSSMKPCSGNPRTGSLQDLFGQLAGVEVQHEQRLLEVYRQVEPGGQDLAEPSKRPSCPKTLEGGFNAQEFLDNQ